MKSFAKLLIAGIGTIMASAFLAGSASATAITDLTGENTLVVGDKTFSDFGCKIVTVGFGGPLECGQIDATGIVVSGNNGIEFQAGFSAVDLGAFASEDVLLSYVVTVTDLNSLISDIHMSFNGSVLGDAIAAVVETVFAGGKVDGQCTGDQVSQITVSNPAPPNPIFSASADILPPQSQVCVRKDILLQAFTVASSGTISFIDQTFSQTTKVPEPATLGLLGVGLLGLGVMRRRRKSA